MPNHSFVTVPEHTFPDGVFCLKPREPKIHPVHIVGKPCHEGLNLSQSTEHHRFDDRGHAAQQRDDGADADESEFTDSH
jgi:hypothetical protein